MGKAQKFGKSLAHGAVGGAQNVIQGEKFGHGFFAAGATQAFAGPINSIDPENVGTSFRRTLAAAALGGSVSAATGGKFANRAITGAFSRALNDEIEQFRREKFQDALDYQVDRVIKARSFNVDNSNQYSGSAIGSYIYNREGFYTLERYINPNQADINAGNPYPGLFSGDYQERPAGIAALVIGDKPHTNLQSIFRNRAYYQRFSESIAAPVFVIPFSRNVGDNVIRFDSKTCTLHPTGRSC